MNIGEIATLRYIGASGRLDSFWQLLPTEEGKPRRLLVSVKVGAAPVVVCEIPVCTNRSKADVMHGAWVLVRKSEGQFLLTAARMPTDFQRIAHSEAFHEDLPVGSISLLDAPPDVAAELANL